MQPQNQTMFYEFLRSVEYNPSSPNPHPKIVFVLFDFLCSQREIMLFLLYTFQQASSTCKKRKKAWLEADEAYSTFPNFLLTLKLEHF